MSDKAEVDHSEITEEIEAAVTEENPDGGDTASENDHDEGVESEFDEDSDAENDGAEAQVGPSDSLLVEAICTEYFPDQPSAPAQSSDAKKVQFVKVVDKPDLLLPTMVKLPMSFVLPQTATTVVKREPNSQIQVPVDPSTTPSSRHTPRPTYPRKCQGCDVLLDDKVTWKRHRRKHADALRECRTQKSDPVVCPHCGKVKNTRTIKRHIREVHTEGFVPKTFPCNYCEKIFRTDGARWEHQMNKHAMSRKLPTLICDMCGFETTIHHRMRRHRLVHSSNSIRCSQCKNLFKDMETYQLHRDNIHPHSQPLQNEPNAFRVYGNREQRQMNRKAQAATVVQVAVSEGSLGDVLDNTHAMAVQRESETMATSLMSFDEHSIASDEVTFHPDNALYGGAAADANMVIVADSASNTQPELSQQTEAHHQLIVPDACAVPAEDMPPDFAPESYTSTVGSIEPLQPTSFSGEKVIFETDLAGGEQTLSVTLPPNSDGSLIKLLHCCLCKTLYPDSDAVVRHFLEAHVGVMSEVHLDFTGQQGFTV